MALFLKSFVRRGRTFYQPVNKLTSQTNVCGRQLYTTLSFLKTRSLNIPSIASSRSVSSSKKLYSAGLRNEFCQKFLEFRESLSDSVTDSGKSVEEWAELERAILEEKPSLKNAFDYIMTKTMASYNKQKMIISFMTYLETVRPQGPNIVTAAVCIKECADHYPDYVVKMFERIKSDKALSFDSDLQVKVVEGLCKTPKWKMALDIFEQQHGIVHKTKMWHALMVSAIRNQAFDTYYYLYYKYRDALLEDGFYTMYGLPTHKYLHETLFQCWQNGELSVDSLLHLLKTSEGYLEESEAMLIGRYLKSEMVGEVDCLLTTVDREKLCCHGCSLTLTENVLNRADFEKLKTNFYDSVIVRNNKFINSDPEELSDFERVLGRQEPFDYVIDGLNVMHKSKRSDDRTRKPDDSNWPSLYTVLKSLELDSSKRVLLILRRRSLQRGQKQNNKPFYDKIEKMAYIYGTKYTSADDLFIMYAAFHSGPHCYIVSNDYLRDHLAMLKTKEHQNLLRKWTKSRQIFNQDNKWMYPVSCSTQETGQGWHVPYMTSQDFLKKKQFGCKPSLFHPSDAFLCIRKNNYKPSDQVVKIKALEIQCMNQLRSELLSSIIS